MDIGVYISDIYSKNVMMSIIVKTFKKDYYNL